MSLGALPLALSLGDASTSRIPLGIVVVGGIMFSLILTLFVIPAMYSFLSTKKKKNALEELDDAAMVPATATAHQKTDNRPAQPRGQDDSVNDII